MDSKRKFSVEHFLFFLQQILNRNLQCRFLKIFHFPHSIFFIFIFVQQIKKLTIVQNSAIQTINQLGQVMKPATKVMEPRLTRTIMQTRKTQTTLNIKKKNRVWNETNQNDTHHFVPQQNNESAHRVTFIRFLFSKIKIGEIKKKCVFLLCVKLKWTL